MSAIETIKSFLPGVEEDTVSATTYECQECDNTFDSPKSPERVHCKECYSRDVEAQ